MFEPDGRSVEGNPTGPMPGAVGAYQDHPRQEDMMQRLVASIERLKWARFSSPEPAPLGQHAAVCAMG